MKKIKLLILFFLLTLFSVSFGLTRTIKAQSVSNSLEATQSSYVLFYPVVAGKTEGEPLYFLKLFRDKLAEMLAFSNEKKSEINLKIATKRLLEAEKLFQAGKSALAQNTLDKFLNKLMAAYEYALKAQQGDYFVDLLNQTEQKAQKYQIVLNQLLNVVQENQKETIQDAVRQVTEIQNKVNQQLNTE